MTSATCRVLQLRMTSWIVSLKRFTWLPQYRIFNKVILFDLNMKLVFFNTYLNSNQCLTLNQNFKRSTTTDVILLVIYEGKSKNVFRLGKANYAVIKEHKRIHSFICFAAHNKFFPAYNFIPQMFFFDLHACLPFHIFYYVTRAA